MALLALLILFLVLITPVTIRVDLRHAQALDALIALRFWGLGPSLRYRLVTTAQGHQLLRLDKHGRPKPRTKPPSVSGKAVLRMIRQVLRGDQARRRFLRGVSLRQLDVALNISLEDAAHTALAAGSIQSVWRALPCAWRQRARLQVRPDFLNGQGSVQARCMVFFRLGILLITAALLLLSIARERTEPSSRGGIHHGTSHW